jgi:hypothetical protein
MVSDKVANIKFSVAQTLLLFIKNGDQKIDQLARTCLKTLSNDADTNVKYFAYNTLLEFQ